MKKKLVNIVTFKGQNAKGRKRRKSYCFTYFLSEQLPHCGPEIASSQEQLL